MVEAKIVFVSKQIPRKKKRLTENTVFRAKNDEDDGSASWDLDTRQFMDHHVCLPSFIRIGEGYHLISLIWNFKYGASSESVFHSTRSLNKVLNFSNTSSTEIMQQNCCFFDLQQQIKINFLFLLSIDMDDKEQQHELRPVWWILENAEGYIYAKCSKFAAKKQDLQQLSESSQFFVCISSPSNFKAVIKNYIFVYNIILQQFIIHQIYQIIIFILFNNHT